MPFEGRFRMADRAGFDLPGAVTEICCVLSKIGKVRPRVAGRTEKACSAVARSCARSHPHQLWQLCRIPAAISLNYLFTV